MLVEIYLYKKKLSYHSVGGKTFCHLIFILSGYPISIDVSFLFFCLMMCGKLSSWLQYRFLFDLRVRSLLVADTVEYLLMMWFLKTYPVNSPFVIQYQ